MDTAEAIDIARQGLWVTLQLGVPVMGVALAVGLAISLFQALTQIQEMTLTFVPKIIVIFITLIFLLPYMTTVMLTFGESMFDRIIALGGA